MVKKGQKREWMGDGTIFEIIEESSPNIWKVKYKDGKHDAHFEFAIDKNSKIISE